MESGLRLSPLAIGAVAVFAQGNVLYGLRLADGYLLWSRAVSQQIAGMWPWQNLVVVLTQPGSSGLPLPVLTGLDASTGRARWRLLIGGSEALPDPPDDAVWQASTGLVYLTWAAELGGGQARQVLLGITAADGGARWRVAVRFAYTAPPDSLDPSDPGLMSVTTSAYSGGTSQDELDPATGRVRWQAVSPYPATATPAGIVTAPGPGQIAMHDTLTGQTLWTASPTSGSQRLVTSTGLISRAPPASRVLPVVPAGPLLIVPEADPGGSDLLAALSTSDGHLAWQVTLPGTLAAPLSAAAGGILVSTVVPGRVMAP